MKYTMANEIDLIARWTLEKTPIPHFKFAAAASELNMVRSEQGPAAENHGLCRRRESRPRRATGRRHRDAGGAGGPARAPPGLRASRRRFAVVPASIWLPEVLLHKPGVKLN